MAFDCRRKERVWIPHSLSAIKQKTERIQCLEGIALN